MTTLFYVSDLFVDRSSQSIMAKFIFPITLLANFSLQVANQLQTVGGITLSLLAAHMPSLPRPVYCIWTYITMMTAVFQQKPVWTLATLSMATSSSITQLKLGGLTSARLILRTMLPL
jgi:hypothetical protein